MKKILSIIAVIGCACLSVRAGNYISLLNGVGITNFNVAVGTTGTNSSGVFTNNAILGQIAGFTTNTFNLQVNGSTQGNLGGGQANTNAYPAVSFSPQANYPNTLYGPYNNTAFFILYQATNNPVLTTVFAGSVDGVLWVSNQLSFSVTANTPFYSNVVSGAMPYYALQSIANTNAATTANVTNIIEVSGKPGL